MAQVDTHRGWSLPCLEGDHGLCRTASCPCPHHGGNPPRTSRPTVTAQPRRLPAREAPCCQAARDDLGRLPIGYCSPECVRRR